MVALVTAVVLGLGLMLSTEEEGGGSPPPCSGGWGGGAKPGTVGMCNAWDGLGRGALLSTLRLSPPFSLSLSLLSTPLLAPRRDCSTVVQV